MREGDVGREGEKWGEEGWIRGEEGGIWCASSRKMHACVSIKKLTKLKAITFSLETY